MKDTIIAGTGNSQYLKTALPAGTTWDDALSMLRAGTFPIDLNGINAAGFTQIGTVLNTQNLFADTTATALGLDTTAVPDDALNALITLLAAKVNAEQAAAAAPVQSVAGKTGEVALDAGDVTYDGTDTYADGTVGAELVETASDVDTALAYALAAFPTDTASGALASFPDGADNIPVKTMTADIDYNANGRTGATVYDDPIYGGLINWNQLVSGVNATGTAALGITRLAVEGVPYAIRVVGTATSSTAFTVSGGSIPTVSGHKYLLTLGNVSLPSGTRIEYSSIDQQASVIPASFSTTRFGIRINSGTTVDIVLYPQAFDLTAMFGAGNEPSTAAEFEAMFPANYYAYNAGTQTTAGAVNGTPGWSKTINWENTVYGGALDVTAGVLTSTLDSSGNPLGTPVTYQLAGEEIKTMLGENHIWADTGDVSVTYRADTGLYIQKLTGATEDDMTANANIPSGSYFMVGNALYLATSAIAQGAAIVPGTNCTLTNLAEALNALNT